MQARDTEERAEWVSRFRETTLPLGAVIKEVMVARDAHWLLASPAAASFWGEGHPPSPQPPVSSPLGSLSTGGLLPK